MLTDMCSIIHYGNINKDTTTYQYFYISVTTYCPTVIALSYELCHQGTTCELPLISCVWSLLPPDLLERADFKLYNIVSNFATFDIF